MIEVKTYGDPKKNAWNIAASNRGFVVKSRKGKRQPKTGPKSKVELMMGKTNARKWRQHWFGRIAEMWKHDLTGYERMFWAAQCEEFEFINYKWSQGRRTGFLLWMWFQSRCFDLHIDRYIPFPNHLSDFPVLFLPPWNPPVLEQASVLSAIAGKAAATDQNLPGTAIDAGGGHAAWSNPENVTAANDSVASATLQYPLGIILTSEILVSNWPVDPPIPELSKIAGIKVGIMCQEPTHADAIRDYVVRLTKAGQLVGDNKAKYNWMTGKTWPWPYQEYGGPMDKWGEEWTREDIMDPGFGLRFAAESTGTHLTDTAHIAEIVITVYYNEPSPVIIRCLNTAPGERAVIPWSTFLKNPPVAETLAHKRRAWYHNHALRNGDHTDYLYDLSTIYPRVKAGTRAVFLHCYRNEPPGGIATTGPASPAQAVQLPYGQAEWDNPGNVCIDDDSVAQALIDAAEGHNNSNPLDCTGFTWDPVIPDPAVIKSIKVEIQGRGQSEDDDCHATSVRLLRTGVRCPGQYYGPAWPKGGEYPWAYDVFDKTAANWDWNIRLLGSHLNNADFGCSFIAWRDKDLITAQVAHVRISATYIDPQGGWCTSVTQTQFVFS